MAILEWCNAMLPVLEQGQLHVHWLLVGCCIKAHTVVCGVAEAQPVCSSIDSSSSSSSIEKSIVSASMSCW
jgi:hypothetical protein